MLPPGVVQLKILRWLRGFRKQLPPSSTPQQYGESRFPFSSFSYLKMWPSLFIRVERQWRCVEFGSLSNVEWEEGKKNPLVSGNGMNVVDDVWRRSSDLWLSGKKLSQKPPGTKKKVGKEEEEGRESLSYYTPEFRVPIPPCACVYLIFPYTFCLELWQVANDARQEEEYKKWKGIFFLVLYFYLSHLFLPGYSSFAPVLAGWIGAPAPKGSKARAPTTYNIYRRPCVHFFLVPTWNLRERAGPFYPPPKFWKCI